jgi:hypothetical protein
MMRDVLIELLIQVIGRIVQGRASESADVITKVGVQQLEAALRDPR